MSIGQRLLLLVAVTVLGLVGSGVYGLVQLKGLQSHFEEVNDRSVPSLIAMSRVNDQFKEERALLLALLMEEDEDLRKAFSDKVSATAAALKVAVDDLQKIPGAEESARELKPIAESYGKAIEAVVASAGTKDLAQVALYTKVVPAEKVFATFLEKSQARLLENQKQLKEQVARNSARTISIFPTIVALTAVIVAVLGFMLQRSVMSSLSTMTETMRSVALKLDFRQRVDVSFHDEVGVAATAFNTLLDTVQASLKEVAGSMAILSASTNRLTGTAIEIQHLSEKTSDYSSAIAATVQDVNAGINHIVIQAEQAEMLARDSGHRASSGGEVIQGTIDQIRAISTTVDAAAIGINELRTQIASISSVVNVIREVADQTNLLALNAAIEAARAGEQGRGFAVVADEVRKLAERTANSTQEIAQLIQSIQQSAVAAVHNMESVVERVESGVSSANTAIGALEDIRGSSDKVLATVADIAVAIRAQGSATSEIAQQFQQIASISGDARRAVAETSQSTQGLEGLANRVNDAVKRYQI